jgi:copper resistance protein B
MKTWLIILFLTFLPAAAPAEDSSFTNPEDRDFPVDDHGVDAHPEKGAAIRKYADDAQSEAQENFGPQPAHDNEIFAVFSGDRLEYQTREGKDLLLWDVQAWVGEDYNKLWFKSEGSWLIDEEAFEEAGTELFYSRNIASFWDAQVGIRHDFKPDPNRTFAAFGVQGLAPLWFEVAAIAYVSEDGDVSAALEVEYDLLLSQRLILQPRLETSIALQEVKEYGIGQGFNDIELGIRLRYEIRRKFAPYIGISWNRKLGETADIAEADGEDVSVNSFVVGVKFWF